MSLDGFFLFVILLTTAVIAYRLGLKEGRRESTVTGTLRILTPKEFQDRYLEREIGADFFGGVEIPDRLPPEIGEEE